MAGPDEQLLAQIRDVVRRVEPGARVILYGSRARGDARPDSDWDLLILVNGAVTHERKEALRDQLYDLELETGAVLSAIIRSVEEWETPLSRAMPFHVAVSRDGREL